MKHHMKFMVFAILVTALVLVGLGTRFIVSNSGDDEISGDAGDDNISSLVDVKLSDFTNLPDFGWAVIVIPDN